MSIALKIAFFLRQRYLLGRGHFAFEIIGFIDPAEAFAGLNRRIVNERTSLRGRVIVSGAGRSFSSAMAERASIASSTSRNYFIAT